MLGWKEKEKKVKEKYYLLNWPAQTFIQADVDIMLVEWALWELEWVDDKVLVKKKQKTFS